MREIKFRGKDYGNDWQYGCLVREVWGQYKNLMIKKDKREWAVLEDTVGQYTGLKDKNGTEIYEGDILNCGDKRIRYVVKWIDTGRSARQINNTSYIGLIAWKNKLEVMGNIHDNPELLGE